MTTETWFQPLTVETAPEGATKLVAATARRFGFLPSPIAKAAGSPPLLQHLIAGFGAFELTSLRHVDREVIAMTVAYEVGCHYCMAMHSALGAASGDVAPHVVALREGAALSDPKLEALRLLTRELVRGLAHVDPARWESFAAAGYTEQQGLEVVLGVSVYLTSTFANIVTRSEIDPPFAAHAWKK